MAERARNLRIAKASGCFMPGPMLADDDSGSLEKWWREHPDDRQPGPGVKSHAPDQASDEPQDMQVDVT